MHSIYQVNSRKRLSPTDILVFDWDNKTTPQETNTNELLSKDEATKLLNNITDGKKTL
nr:hypothetical protein [uncultured Draconibacterium sp.]